MKYCLLAGSLNPITGLPNNKSETVLPTTPDRPAKRRGYYNPKTGLTVDQTAASPQTKTPEKSAKRRGYHQTEGF